MGGRGRNGRKGEEGGRHYVNQCLGIQLLLTNLW